MTNNYNILQELQLGSFKIKDHSYDTKIDALNVFGIIKIKDYLKIATIIKSNNELQRKRVATPSTVYSLLKDDIRNGCLIPSIVLALDENQQYEIELDNIEYKTIEEHVQKQAEHLKLLDGLQRTNILIDLQKELLEKNNKPEEKLTEDIRILEDLYERDIRVEIYVNISRFGILYRMLTLNTGQTPMSLRHQIEILYSDYFVIETNGIILIRDAFDTKPTKVGQYKFSDIIEGITSYIDGSEFPLDRFDLLNYIKSLRKLSSENYKEDIFIEFLNFYHKFLKKIIELSNGWKFEHEALSVENLSFFPVMKVDADGRSQYTAPFGANAEAIFIKSQIFTALGSALSGLKNKKVITTIGELTDLLGNITFDVDTNNSFDVLSVRLEQVRKDSKKIGESQRTFFKNFFTSLFNKQDDETFLNFDTATESAFRKTTQVMPIMISYGDDRVNPLILKSWDPISASGKLVHIQTSNEFTIEYPLPVVQPTEIFNESSIFLFKNKYGTNDDHCFTVQLDSARVGKLIPLRVFKDSSNLPTMAEDRQLYRFLYIAFYHLINASDVINKDISYDELNSYRNNLKIEDFYDDETVVFLYHSTGNPNLSFNIKDHYASFLRFGYVPITKFYDYAEIEMLSVRSDESPLYSFQIGSIIPLSTAKNNLNNEKYIQQSLELSLKYRITPLVRFMMLYQMIELIIDKIAVNNFKDNNPFDRVMASAVRTATSATTFNEIIDDLKTIQNKINKSIEIKKEDARITQMFELKSKLYARNYSDLIAACQRIIPGASSDSLTENVYLLRNRIIHGYHILSTTYSNLDELLSSFNLHFEKLMADVLIKYEE